MSSDRIGTAPLEAFEKFLTEDLHDSVCQSLAGTSFLVNALRRQAETGKAVSADDLQKIAGFLERAVDDLRALISPDSLSATGLGGALQKFAAESSNAPCRVTVQADARVEEPRTALVLYRLARWAARQAMKSTGEARVELRREHGVILEVHAGRSGAFFSLPEDDLGFLQHYAATASVVVSLEEAGRTLRASVPAG